MVCVEVAQGGAIGCDRHKRERRGERIERQEQRGSSRKAQSRTAVLHLRRIKYLICREI